LVLSVHEIHIVLLSTTSLGVSTIVDKFTVCKYGRKITINSDYYLNNIKLEEVHTVKDLGVTFDDHLQFKDHCLDKITYAMLGLIKRNLAYSAKIVS